MQRSPRRHRAVARCAAVATCLAIPLARLDAQRVLGIGEDAFVVPRGVLRFDAPTAWINYNERFGLGRFGRTPGAPEPLGAPFNVDTVGPAQMEMLGPLQDRLRALSGIPGLGVSLGRSVFGIEVAQLTEAFNLELGIGRRASLNVRVPVVSTRSDVFFNPNPGGTEGNLGINPALGSAAVQQTNALVATQLESASTRLQNALAACQASPGSDPACATVNANRTNAAALQASTAAFITAYRQVYGTTTAAARFIPVRGTSAQAAIEARIGAFNALYKAALGLAPSAPDLVSARPTPASTVLAFADFQHVLTDTTFGIAAAPLEGIERNELGDVEIGAKVMLVDSFRGDTTRRRGGARGLRTAVGALVRLATGRAASPDNFTDVGAGDGQRDVEVRVITDVGVTRRFWATVVGRYGMQLPDRPIVRVPASPSEFIVPAYRRGEVSRNLGDYLELEVTPRYDVTEFIALALQYRYRHKGADQYSGTFTATDLEGSQVTIDASILGEGTASTDHRVGGGFVYSTVSAYSRGKARIPLELSYLHYQSVAGSGNQLKLFSSQVQLRLYLPLFGRGLR